MKKITLLLIITLTTASCKREKNIPEGFDYGTVKESAYYNDFFDFKLDFPEGWHVLDQSQQNQLMNQSVDLIADEDSKKALDASLINVANLFTAFEKPIGTTIDFNPSILINAENLKNFPGDPTVEAYMVKAMEFMDQTGMDYKIISEQREVSIDGQKFLNTEIQNTIQGNTINQINYVTVKNGFAINMFLSYIEAEDKDVLQEVITSMKFK